MAIPKAKMTPTIAISHNEVFTFAIVSGLKSYKPIDEIKQTQTGPPKTINNRINTLIFDFSDQNKTNDKNQYNNGIYPRYCTSSIWNKQVIAITNIANSTPKNPTLAAHQL